MTQFADAKVSEQDFLRIVMQQVKQDKIEAQEFNKTCFSVLSVHCDWLQKGYINSSEVSYFSSEHDAIDYVEKFNKSGKGFAKLRSPEK